MKAVVARSDDPVPPASDIEPDFADQPVVPPSRARFAAVAILSGLGSGAALYALLLSGSGWAALLLCCSIGLCLSCLAAMLVFRRVQLPLEAVHSLSTEQALRLQAFEAGADLPVETQPPAELAVPDEASRLRAAVDAARASADAVQRQMQSLLAASDDGLLLLGRDGRIEAASPAVAALVDLVPRDLIDRPLTSLLPLFDDSRPEPLQHSLTATLLRLFDPAAPASHAFAALLERRGRTSVRLRLDVRPLRDATNNVQSLLLRLDPVDGDVLTGRHPAAAPSESLDPLSPAPGEQPLRRRVAELQRQARLDGSHHGLLLIAIDACDALHDRLGVLAGEQQLWQFAQAVRLAAAQPADFHRLSGRHFALLLPRQSLDACRDRAAALCAALAESQSLSPSIGLVGIDGRLGTEALLAAANDALRTAQQDGGGCLRLAPAEPIDDSPLRARIEAGALRLAAQPMVVADPQPGEAASPWLDLLPRIEDDDGSWLPLDAFSAALDRSGLTVSVDEWLLDTGLRHDLGNTRLLIRLSSMSLRCDDFVDGLCARLQRSAHATHQVCIAVDEAFILEYPQRAALLRDRLAPFACNWLIDQCRSGRILDARHRFPAHYLRLHGGLVAACGRDPQVRGTLEALVARAHALGVQIVAGGICDADTQERMRLAGADYLQGPVLGSATPFSA